MIYKRAALVWLLQGGGEGNSVIFINQDILPKQEDACFCFTLFLTSTRNINENERIVLFIMIIGEILLFLLFVLILGPG